MENDNKKKEEEKKKKVDREALELIKKQKERQLKAKEKVTKNDSHLSEL